MQMKEKEVKETKKKEIQYGQLYVITPFLTFSTPPFYREQQQSDLTFSSVA